MASRMAIETVENGFVVRSGGMLYDGVIAPPCVTRVARSVSELALLVAVWGRGLAEAEGFEIQREPALCVMSIELPRLADLMAAANAVLITHRSMPRLKARGAEAHDAAVDGLGRLLGYVDRRGDRRTTGGDAAADAEVEAELDVEEEE